MRAPPPTMTDRPDWPDAWTLFLDIDGTLLELAPRPELVMVPPDLPARLYRLADALGGALALVSGRPLATIDWLFPVGLDAVGTHGA
ncbi:MAG: trehalose-phosphatase, partial [Chromatiaceae bacterium]